MIITKESNNPVIKELIRLVFYNFAKRGRINLSKKQVLKILYQVKMELPQDNTIKDKLAYYWYKNGPFSQVFYDNFEDMKNNQIQRVDNSQLEIYKYSDEYLRKRLVEITDDIEESRTILGKKVEQFVNMNDLMNDVYSKYAPTKFYISYNINFRNKFDNFCSYILDSRKISSKNRYKRIDVDEFLSEAIIDLQKTELFFQFRCIFKDFSKALYELLGIKSDYNEKEKELLLKAKELYDDIWNVFSYGIRIEEHDEFYNQYERSWKDKYFEEINKLEEKVNLFADLIFKSIQNKTKFNPELDKQLQSLNTKYLKKYTPDEYLEYLHKITN